MTGVGIDPARDALARSGLIEGLGERADELLPYVEEVQLGAGEVTFAEGDVADALYIVLVGAVQVVGAGRSQREIGEHADVMRRSIGRLVSLVRQLHAEGLYAVWRRYPPVPGLARFTQADGEVPPDPETGIGAFSFRRDTLVIASVVGIHMDPDRYPQPFEYRPGRFMTGVSAEMTLRARGRRVRENAARLEETNEFLTFGNGPGRCPGQAFNMLESFVVLDGLLTRFDVTLADPYTEVPIENSALGGPAWGHVGITLRRRSA